ncbi:MAG: response regulator transcription factor [Ignavibacteria bacterium]
MNIKLLVADDHALFRSGIISMLEDINDIFVVGQAKNGEELIEQYFCLKPDVVLADISMEGMSGPRAVAKIKERDENIKALFLSMHQGEEYIFHCLKSGGLGLISKDIMQGEMVFAIKSIFNGNKYFGASWTEEALDALVNKYSHPFGPIDIIGGNLPLTKTEMEVLLQLGLGYTSKEISDILGLAKRTVDTHRSNIMQKLGFTKLPEVIKFAIMFEHNKKIG